MKRLILVLTALVAVLQFSCQRELSVENGLNSTPTLITSAVSSITSNSVVSGGDISSDGGAAITVRGVCWGTSSNPLVTGNHTTDGTGIGTFASTVTGLLPNTTYFVRAYATNSVGTGYGNELTFTTTSSAGLPTITTLATTSVTSTTAISGGIITSDGGSNVTGRGVCWSTSPSPIITGNFTADGTGIGTFASAVTNLLPNTTYYIRAYATNSIGTAYGNELTFTTPAPDVYAVGADYSGAVSTATLWKNGIPTALANGPNPSIAVSVYVAGTDVYVAGTEKNGSVDIVKVWKNGNATSLTNNSDTATVSSIVVSGSDVYVGGSRHNGTKNVPSIWKNGIATSLSTPTTSYMMGYVSAIFISGVDVYAVGNLSYASGLYELIVWKNGVPTILNIPPPYNAGELHSIYVSGSDVYVCGRVDDATGTARAIVWKNGIGTLVATATYPAIAYSVFVSGTDVYVGGMENGNGRIWKNGIVMPIASTPNSEEIESIFVSGSDIYAAGDFIDGPSFPPIVRAKIWKNGVATLLAPNTNLSSIFVK